jgi:hypothetical protein
VAASFFCLELTGFTYGYNFNNTYSNSMDMRFGKWNIRSLNRAGSLMTIARELSRYRLDLAQVQDVRWNGSDTDPAGEYTFFYGK